MPVNRIYEEFAKDPIISAVFVNIAVVIAMPAILAGFAITKVVGWIKEGFGGEDGNG
jgi:hypothetical protein